MPDSQDDLADLDSTGSTKLSKREQKKNRKPYTITKPRESWTDEEHDLFLEALQLFEREWKQIEAHIKTKTVIQIRSHAQKYFQKMQKTGKQDCIPPPRPKRRSKKPYPKIARDRKPAPINHHHHHKGADFSSLTQGSVVNQDYMNASYPFSSPTPNMVHHVQPPRSIVNQHTANLGNSLQFALFEREQLAQLHQEQLAQAQFYLQQAVAAHITDEKKSDLGGAAKTPNFQKIYSFLGSLFDPSTTGHVDQLRMMNDIDRQVVQLLMQNLASNLSKQHAISSELSSSQETVPKDVYMTMSNDQKAMLQSSTRPGAMPIDQSASINAHTLSNDYGHGSLYPGASTTTL